MLLSRRCDVSFILVSFFAAAHFYKKKNVKQIAESTFKYQLEEKIALEDKR